MRKRQRAVSFVWEKDEPMSRRRSLGWATVGLWAVISALVRYPIRVWLVGTIVIVIGVAGILVLPQTLTVNAATESNPPQNCISCHPRTLKGHDKLGSGSKACWVCHDKTDMGILRLAEGTSLSLSESAQLCGQCHQKRYDAWKEGTHGIPAWKEGVPAIPGADKAKCADCHDPHQPQVALWDITKPHPAPAPSPPPPSANLLIILGISLLLMIGIGAAVAKRGEGP